MMKKQFLRYVMGIMLVVSLVTSLCPWVLANDDYITDSNFRYKLNDDNISVTVIEYTGNSMDIEIPAKVYDYPVTRIAQKAFDEMGFLSIIIPDTITEIGPNAFKECDALTSLIIPAGVTVIESAAFRNCTGLKNLEIRGDITQIRTKAFENCSGLEILNLPDSLTSVYLSAFNGCTSLKYVKFPEGITNLNTTLAEVCENIMLYCYENSQMHQYAQEEGIEVCILDEYSNPDIEDGIGICAKVQSSDGSPAADVKVELIDKNGRTRKTVDTDSAGECSFTHAEEGAYSLYAYDEYGCAGYERINVKRNSENELYIEGSTVITLQASSSVNVNVTSSGAAEEGAEVILLDEDGAAVFKAENGADGVYSFSNVPNGTYLLKAVGENGAAFEQYAVYSGKTNQFNAVLEPSSAVSGVVTDESGMPVSWGRIKAVSDEGIILQVSNTNADGEYIIEGLTGGDYCIVADNDGNEKSIWINTEQQSSVTGNISFAEETENISVSAQADNSVQGTEEYWIVFDWETGAESVFQKNTDGSFTQLLSEAEELQTLSAEEENTTEESYGNISGAVTYGNEAQNALIMLYDTDLNEIDICNSNENGEYVFENVPNGNYTIRAVTDAAGAGFGFVSVDDGVVEGKRNISVQIPQAVSSLCSEISSLSENAQNSSVEITQAQASYNALTQREKYCLPSASAQKLDTLVKAVTGIEIAVGNQCAGYSIAPGEGFAYTGAEALTVTENENINITEENGREIIKCFELDLSKTSGENNLTIDHIVKDTSATGKVKITVSVPEEARNGEAFRIRRIVNNESVTLCDLDESEGTVTFETDKLGAFVLERDRKEYEISYDETTKTATVTALKDGSAVLVFASYSNNGTLKDVQTENIQIISGTAQVTANDFNAVDTDEIKIMLLNDMGTLKPLCEAWRK